jgi:hypothetical protein
MCSPLSTLHHIKLVNLYVATDNSVLRLLYHVVVTKAANTTNNCATFMFMIDYEDENSSYLRNVLNVSHNHCTTTKEHNHYQYLTTEKDWNQWTSSYSKCMGNRMGQILGQNSLQNTTFIVLQPDNNTLLLLFLYYCLLNRYSGFMDETLHTYWNVVTRPISTLIRNYDCNVICIRKVDSQCC